MIPPELTADVPPSLDLLVASLYDEIKQIAHLHRGRQRRDVTLNTTALVHEAYLRMARAGDNLSVQDQQHFKALTSRIVRHVLVDYARRSHASKREGVTVSLEMTAELMVEPSMNTSVLDLDAALHRLAHYSPRLEKVVECRFFGGMNVSETAQTLDMSVRSVERDWQRARIYLLRLLDTDKGLAAELDHPGRPM